jgi:hypothetical protein
MMQLEFRTPPAFHVQPFGAEPAAAARRGWLLCLLAAVLIAALLNTGLVLGARSARRPGGTGISSALGDWLADLDEPQLSQSALGQQ